MLKFSVKNNLQRLNIKKYELTLCTQKILQIFLSNKDYPSKTIIQKYLSNLKQFNTPSNSSSRLRSVCILTGRSRSVYRSFKMSRLKVKEYANMGFFIGMSKSS
jgi:ribosomal protein S14